MKLGIIGLEQSGKTTVFNALTGQNKEVSSFGRLEANIGMIKVPDERIDWLKNLFNPKKTTYADIEFIDIPGSINDSSDAKIVATARESDALVFIVRLFEDPNVLHPLNSLDPLRDYNQIKTGLIIADLQIAEKRIERLKVSTKKLTDKQKEELFELSVLEKIMKNLENELPASSVSLTAAEEKIIRSFQFLSLKPFLCLVNVSENDLSSPKTSEIVSAIPDSIAMCAKIEAEIQGLEISDRQLFLEELGIKELSLYPFIRKAYSTLGLISFFTVGEDEVRAWTINKNTPAVTAAGAIHSDLERGFIRAEIFSFEDIKALGSEREVKNAGKLRLEGKTYMVQDGDILHIKFSV